MIKSSAPGDELEISADPDIVEATAVALREDTAGRGAPLHWLPRTRVIALSGLDGAGKSSQSRALSDRLHAQGPQVHVYWLPLGHNRVQRALRRWIRRFARAPRRDGAPVRSRDAAPVPPAGARAAEHGPLRVHAWVLFVALSCVLSYRLALARHAARGRVLVFDRYVLDAIAQIRYFYGPERRFAFQTWLLRVLSPRPIYAYLLDVPASTALARKQEQFGLEELQLQADLLREEAARLGIRCLDGEQPHERLLHEILADFCGERL